MPLGSPELTEEVAMSDIAFGGLGKEGGALMDALVIGFPPDANKKGGIMHFVKYNKKAGVSTAVKIDPTKPYDPKKPANTQFTYSIDYTNMIIARGNIPPIAVTAELDKESKKVLFEQIEDPFSGGNRQADDVAYGVIYDPVAMECIVEELKERSASGSSVAILPNYFNMDALAVYAFTVPMTGKRVSNSRCLLYDKEANLSLKARMAAPLAEIEKQNRKKEEKKMLKAAERARKEKAAEEKQKMMNKIAESLEKQESTGD